MTSSLLGIFTKTPSPNQITLTSTGVKTATYEFGANASLTGVKKGVGHGKREVLPRVPVPPPARASWPSSVLPQAQPNASTLIPADEGLSAHGTSQLPSLDTGRAASPQGPLNTRTSCQGAAPLGDVEHSGLWGVCAIPTLLLQPAQLWSPTLCTTIVMVTGTHSAATH